MRPINHRHAKEMPMDRRREGRLSCSRTTRAVITPVLALIIVISQLTGTDRAQVLSGPRAHAENVTFEAQGAGVIAILFDLVSDTPNDSNQRFNIELRASEDAGKTFA